MGARLFGLSFHSVKGGVGKSTLATLAAIGIARRHPGSAVWLIDMDLTGTSLGDALPLCAPRWSTSSEEPDLKRLPDEVWTRGETERLIEQRGGAAGVPGKARKVPYLNDFLLFSDPSWEEDEDALPQAVGWCLEGGPENLRVLPSSALPLDLIYTLPVIFDEDHAAFLEARLELLLAGLMTTGGDVWVVFDVPPTIPGLSRAVLGLGLRLGRPAEDRIPLATLDPTIPRPLDSADIQWRAHIVSSMDPQDLRAASRWADLVSETDVGRVRAVFNRLGDAEMARQDSAWEDDLQARLGVDTVLPQLWMGASAPMRVPDSDDLRIFHDGRLVEEQVVVREMVDQLLAGLCDVALS
jgi:hypothetical protein